jgi:sterol desaturase/sphingolipid hydroxylase (fatty acid hydroxylase superfamily)
MQIEDLPGLVITLLFIIGLIAERFIPRERQVVVPKWRLLGIVFFLINAGINTALPLIIPTEWIVAHSLLPGAQLGVVGGFIVGFLVWEFIYYWFHRFEHRFDPLWRMFHQLHHSPTRMDISGFPITHPLEIVATGLLSIFITVGVLGLDSKAAALVGLYIVVVAVVQHLNCATPRWLEWFMQRPEAHARHHEYGEHAGNYADWPVLDKLFGTYRAPPTQGSMLRYGFDQAAAKRIPSMLLWKDVNRDGKPLVHHE